MFRSLALLTAAALAPLALMAPTQAAAGRSASVSDPKGDVRVLASPKGAPVKSVDIRRFTVEKKQAGMTYGIRVKHLRSSSQEGRRSRYHQVFMVETRFAGGGVATVAFAKGFRPHVYQGDSSRLCGQAVVNLDHTTDTAWIYVPNRCLGDAPVSARGGALLEGHSGADLSVDRTRSLPLS